MAAAGVGILSTDFTYFIYPKIKRLFTAKKSSTAIILPSYNNGAFSISLVKGSELIVYRAIKLFRKPGQLFSIALRRVV